MTLGWLVVQATCWLVQAMSLGRTASSKHMFPCVWCKHYLVQNLSSFGKTSCQHSAGEGRALVLFLCYNYCEPIWAGVEKLIALSVLWP